MKISYNWLKDYLQSDVPPEKMSEILTDCGLEVEGLTRWYAVEGGLEGVVIGEVLSCIKHPNSNHLSLATVNIGAAEPLKIVCGAPNVAAGQKVAVATIGTKLGFGGKETVIQRSKIRGEVSEGMICAEDELGMGTSHDGILVLSPDAVPGTPGRDYFHIAGDFVFEIGLTPNRTDAMCHLGIARDLAAALNNAGRQKTVAGPKKSVVLPPVDSFRRDLEGRSIQVSIEDAEACPRYSGVTITGITVGESPDWLKNRLLAVGLRPINNVVDVTNFIMMDLGQPLHAFDADKIGGDRIVVRKYPDGTPFVTLDNTERKLTASDLMISSVSEPLCIAGVFGGIGSGVIPETRNLFIESAYFNPSSVRKTSKHHGLQTDSSFRFERGANYEITVYALKRAALMIKELAGGEISSEIVDVYPHPIPRPEVRMRFSHLDRLAGTSIPREVAASILADLGQEILAQDADGITVSVPGFKADVRRESDVIEEVLRIYGYNTVEIPAQVRTSLNVQHGPDKEKLRTVVSGYLSSVGFYEIMNNSLSPSAWYENDPAFTADRLVKMINPLSRDLDSMRQTLLFGGLESIMYNHNRKAFDLKMFELGSVYSLADPGAREPLPGYHEETRLALFLTGKKTPENWNTPAADTDFYELKGYLHSLFEILNIPPAELDQVAYTHPHLTAGLAYESNGRILAFSGRVSRNLLKRFDCKQDVYYADIRWDLLTELAASHPIQFTGLPRFPEVRRDLALLVDASVSFSSIQSLAFQTEKKLLKKTGLFDVYEGEKIGRGKKSYALSFILRDEEKTLTDAEIDQVMQKLIRAFEKQLNAVIR